MRSVIREEEFRSLSFKLIFTLSVIAANSFNTCAAAEEPTKINSIAVIPVTEPTWFSLNNRNALAIVVSPLIGVGTAIDSRSKAEIFTEKMKAQHSPLGNELTKIVVEVLNQKEFHTSVLSNIKRPADDPNNIDYSDVKTDADAVLHVYFNDVGVESGYTSVDYLPRVNIYGYLFNPKDGEYIHEETVYYGVDSREGKPWGVPASPKFGYRSFDELIQKAPEVIGGFSEGTVAAGKRLAENMSGALR